MAKKEVRPLRWLRLDNAAKIYPAARRKNWSNVFRQSVTLCDDVDTDVLKSALDITVKRFPSIAAVYERVSFGTICNRWNPRRKSEKNTVTRLPI